MSESRGGEGAGDPVVATAATVDSTEATREGWAGSGPTDEVNQHAREHWRELVKIARSRGCSQPEEAASDALMGYLRVLRQQGIAARAQDTRAYLNTFLHHVMKNMRREASRESKKLAKVAGAVHGAMGTVSASDVPAMGRVANASQAAEWNDAVSAVERTAASLGTTAREAVMLRVRDSLTIEEIAARLECSPRNVQASLRRSWKHLREELEAKGVRPWRMQDSFAPHDGGRA